MLHQEPDISDVLLSSGKVPCIGNGSTNAACISALILGMLMLRVLVLIDSQGRIEIVSHGLLRHPSACLWEKADVTSHLAVSMGGLVECFSHCSGLF